MIAERIALAPSVVDAIAGHAEECVPNECCGVLIGHPDAPAINEAWPAANAEPWAPAERFRLKPADLHRLARRAREASQDIVGFYHSHPHGEAVPSTRDVHEASGWPGYFHIIYASGSRVAGRRMRLYRTETDGWRELSLAGPS